MTHLKILIIGATGGIGNAMLNQLAADKHVEQIYATHRQSSLQKTPHDKSLRTYNGKVQWINMDVTDEDSIKQAVKTIKQHTSYLNWIINTAGVLHTKDHHPEKSIRQIDPQFFTQNMTVNALASLLIAKHIKPLLKAGQRDEHHPAIFATISARVGSISDNRLGGWYSYRMSKAALNMGMKTLSLEWQRSLKNVCVVVMQPGTVDTPLSEPFQKNVPKDKLFNADDTAKNLLNVLYGMSAKETGSFVDWAGKSIPW